MRKLMIVLVATAFVLGLCFSATAQTRLFYMEREQLPVPPVKEIDVYGSVRVMTYIQDIDKESIGTGVGTFDDRDLVWTLDDGSSRFGVRFRAGKVGANVEIRPRDRQIRGFGGQFTLLRHWNATYDLGWGTFLVGQAYTPTFNPICNECLLGGGGVLDGYGDMGGSVRKPGLQLHMPVPALNGLLKLGLLEPTTQRMHPALGLLPAFQGLPSGAISGGVPTQNRDAAGWTGSDTAIPAIEASLSTGFGPMSFTLLGGYNTYKAEETATDATEKIDSYLLGLSASYSIGAMYLRGLVYFGQNLAAFGSASPFSNATYGFSPALHTTATGVAVEDAENFGWFGVMGYKFTDMFSVEAGYGQRKSEIDDPLLGGTWKDKKSAFVVFFPISVTRTFIITPEVLWTDEGDFEGPLVAGGKFDRGNKLFYGIYWRIDF